MKLPKYYVIVCLLFLLSKARQAKRKFKVKKIMQTNDKKTKNKVTKICNEPGIKGHTVSGSFIFIENIGTFFDLFEKSN